MQEKRLHELAVRRTVVNNVTTIIARGDCDICSVQLLKDTMTDVIRDGHNELIVDIKNLKLLDSSALAAVLWARHKIEENGGNLVLVGFKDKSAHASLSIVNLLDLASTIKEALTLFNKRKSFGYKIRRLPSPSHSQQIAQDA